MKNLIYSLIAACFFMLNTADAQTPMVKGNNLVMAGLGIGGYGRSVSSTVSPTFMATFQRGIVNDLGPGNLSVGGTIAVKTGTYDGFSTDVRWNYFAFAGRASYHPHFVKSEKFDLFGGLGLGYYSANAKVEGFGDVGIASASAIAITFHLGARYAINEKFGVWAELGTELSLLSGGVSYSF